MWQHRSHWQYLILCLYTNTLCGERITAARDGSE
nr:MAG TPA: hypothetical protein [Caudoviricetes sp.]DAU23545.1 MAG TPA: hypothetical protein [Caudoviricetes sp.]